MRDVPLRLYQNRGDIRVPVSVSRRIAKELAACGGRVDLTIFANEGHDAWDRRLRGWPALRLAPLAAAAPSMMDGIPR